MGAGGFAKSMEMGSAPTRTRFRCSRPLHSLSSCPPHGRNKDLSPKPAWRNAHHLLRDPPHPTMMKWQAPSIRINLPSEWRACVVHGEVQIFAPESENLPPGPCSSVYSVHVSALELVKNNPTVGYDEEALDNLPIHDLEAGQSVAAPTTQSPRPPATKSTTRPGGRALMEKNKAQVVSAGESAGEIAGESAGVGAVVGAGYAATDVGTTDDSTADGGAADGAAAVDAENDEAQAEPLLDAAALLLEAIPKVEKVFTADKRNVFMDAIRRGMLPESLEIGDEFASTEDKRADMKLYLVVSGWCNIWRYDKDGRAILKAAGRGAWCCSEDPLLGNRSRGSFATAQAKMVVLGITREDLDTAVRSLPSKGEKVWVDAVSSCPALASHSAWLLATKRLTRSKKISDRNVATDRHRRLFIAFILHQMRQPLNSVSIGSSMVSERIHAAVNVSVRVCVCEWGGESAEPLVMWAVSLVFRTTAGLLTSLDYSVPLLTTCSLHFPRACILAFTP